MSIFNNGIFRIFLQFTVYNTTMATTSTTTMLPDPVWATAFFRPTRRLRNTLGEIVLRKEITDTKRIEIELLPEFTTEQVLAEADMTWDQCCRFFNGKFVWMAPTVFFSNAFLPSSLHAPPVLSIGPERDNPLGRIMTSCRTAVATITLCFGAIATTTDIFCVYTTEDTNPRDPAVMATCDFF